MDIPGGLNTTTGLQVGGALVNSLEQVGDKDWIAIDLVAGESYLFTLTGSGANPLFDPFLELRNASGVNVAQDDDAGPGLNPQLRFTATESGTYYLVAQSYEDENQSPTAGQYTLTADFGPAQNPLDAIDWGTKLASNTVDVFFAPSGYSAGGFTSDGWTPLQINAVLAVMETISNVANLIFNQVFSAPGAEFRLITTSESGLEFSGRMGPPGTGGAGVGVFNTNSALWNNSLAPGSSGFALIIHELLHGLGFAHPHDNGGSSEVLQGVVDDRGSFGFFDLNQGVYTNISYNSGFSESPAFSHNYGQQGGPSALDVALLQQKYGANTNHNAFGDVYTLTDGNQAGQFFTTIWDTGGTDSIEYHGVQNAVIDLRPATLVFGEGAGGFVSKVSGVAGGFTIAADVLIENAAGGDGADKLTGNDGPNSLYGNDGADTLAGGAGADTLNGGAGADHFMTDLASADLVNGDSGDDTLVVSQNRSDVAVFGDDLDPSALFGFEFSGVQTILTNVEIVSFLDETIRLYVGAAAGEDVSAIDGLNGYYALGDGADTVSGGVGDDTISGPLSGAHKLIDGGPGADFISTGDGSDTINGEEGADRILSGAGADLLNGGPGDDYFSSGEGDDTAFGGAGNDTFEGGAGLDDIYGGDGDDLISYVSSPDEGVSVDLAAGAGSGGAADGDILISIESVLGSSFADTLTGNETNNTLSGGQGDDFLSGKGGADVLDGGDGFDTASYEDAAGAVFIRLWDGFGAGDASGDTLINVERVLGGDFSDTLEGSNAAAGDQLIGGGGGDLLHGLGGGDLIEGGADNDTIAGGFGDDTLDGGAGDDTIGGQAGRDSLAGGAGADTLHGFGSHDTLLGGDDGDDLRGGFGRDLLGGSGGEDVLRGFDGEDRLFGGGDADTLIGNDGDDSLTGGGGADRLRGDAGNDTLNGRFGDDSVTGGAGDDLFQFRQGHGADIYDDFTPGAGTDDVIQLVAFGAAFDTFAEVISAATDNGNHTTIDFGGGDSIVLLNVTVAALHEDDFIFT
ncbi:M10 family metallopeptidase C-terminal domain-containing protein [Hyphococcus sp.]|uniref:M10 family metallopeptidase C-terminal domain-containing protein n=1 Tax=Hyphococcus sp. TaxID=2038636 RepID=UPI003CCBA9EE